MEEKVFENVNCKMASISQQPQYVNQMKEM